MTDDTPDPSIAVSPTDQSSDREQSDADNLAAVAHQAGASSERAAIKQQAYLDHAVTIDRLDTLTASIDRQAKSNTELALATVEYQERARTAARRFRTTMIVLAVVFAVLYWRQNQSIDSGHSTGHLIADCVKPSGQCFKDAQQRTVTLVGAVVSAISADGVVRAACAQAEERNTAASVNQRITDMTACIAAHTK